MTGLGEMLVDPFRSEGNLARIRRGAKALDEAADARRGHDDVHDLIEGHE